MVNDFLGGQSGSLLGIWIIEMVIFFPVPPEILNKSEIILNYSLLMKPHDNELYPTTFFFPAQTSFTNLISPLKLFRFGDYRINQCFRLNIFN